MIGDEDELRGMISSRDFLLYIVSEMEGLVDRHRLDITSCAPVRDFGFEMTLREIMGLLAERDAY